MIRLTLASVFGLLATPLLAGNPLPPPDDPVIDVIAPAVTVVPEFSWTGGYAGAQIGYGEADTNIGISGDGAIGGLHLGYRHDFGGFVLGVELAHDWADITLQPGAVEVDNVTRLALTGGVSSGANLFYAVAGAAQADVSGGAVGTAEGVVYGIGYAHMLNANTVLGVEWPHYDLDDGDFAPGVTAEGDSLQGRVSFKF